MNMKTVRIGALRISVVHVDEHSAHLMLCEDDPNPFDDKPLAPSDRGHDRVVVPVALWHALETLLAFRDEIDGVRAIAMSNDDWPQKTGDERTDLVAQRSALASRLGDVTNALMKALMKARR